MSMSDPIADLLTRIRNADSADHNTLEIPASNMKSGILKVLKDEGFIKDYSRKEEDNKPVLEIKLKEHVEGKSVFHEIKRISKPSRRVYIKAKDIRSYKSGLGVSILSTSQGILTHVSARKQGIGGEILCTVW